MWSFGSYTTPLSVDRPLFPFVSGVAIISSPGFSGLFKSTLKFTLSSTFPGPNSFLFSSVVIFLSPGNPLPVTSSSPCFNSSKSGLWIPKLYFASSSDYWPISTFLPIFVSGIAVIFSPYFIGISNSTSNLPFSSISP